MVFPPARSHPIGTFQIAAERSPSEFSNYLPNLPIPPAACNKSKKKPPELNLCQRSGLPPPPQDLCWPYVKPDKKVAYNSDIKKSWVYPKLLSNGALKLSEIVGISTVLASNLREGKTYQENPQRLGWFIEPLISSQHFLQHDLGPNQTKTYLCWAGLLFVPSWFANFPPSPSVFK